MKTCLVIALLCWSSLALFADIYSTTAGGNWINGSTWIGGVVPTEETNVVIQGNVYLETTQPCHNLSISSNGRLTNLGDQGVGQVTIHGNLVNSGELVDSGVDGELRLVVFGNLTNQHIATCEYIYFAGTQAHNLSNYGSFSPRYLLNMDYATVTLLTDLSTTGTFISLPWLDLDAGVARQLTLNGGYMQHCNLLGGNGSSLSLNSGAWMANLTADEIVLYGTVPVGDGVQLTNLINYAALYNLPDLNHSLYIYGDLENHGSIGNNPAGHELNLRLDGDLRNYQSFTPQYLELGSDGIHDLWQDAGAQPISVPHITSWGDYRLLSDISFADSEISWTGHTLYMQSGASSYGLNLDGGALLGITLDGGPASFLNMSDEAWLSGVSADELIFQGEVLVSDNVSVDRLLNQALLRNRNDASHTMDVNQALVNQASIVNSGPENTLSINLFGDFSSYGIMLNQSTRMMGTQDQALLRGAGSQINCPDGFQLWSELGFAQWYFNGVLNDAEYSQYKIIDPGVNGIWNPYNGSVFGRDITIGSASVTLTAPQNVSAVLVNGLLRLQWDQVAGAAFYTVYESSSPAGSYEALAGNTFDANLSDGVVAVELIPQEAIQFYRVTAGQ